MGIFESLPPRQRELIEEHLRLVISANERVNLTRIDSFDEGMLLHVEDSLAGLAELNKAPDGLYGDLGSGAGYPGIPLAIASGRQSVLIDARKKKMDVMQDIIGELGLSNQISVFAGRAELLARMQSKRYVALTARALSQLPVLLELASPLLEKGGLLICYKANLPDDELNDAKQIRKLVGMSLQSDRGFMLGDGYTRRLLVFVKTDEPTIKLPRQEGIAQKHPLTE